LNPYLKDAFANKALIIWLIFQIVEVNHEVQAAFPSFQSAFIYTRNQIRRIVQEFQGPVISRRVLMTATVRDKLKSRIE
jgi:hypothetical protein